MKSDRRKIVAVIGNKAIEKDGVRYKIAYEIGKALVDNGYRVQTGGLQGVMSAVLEGAKASKNYREGDTIALVPSFDTETANEFADIVIPTGLDMMRNALVANAYAVIGVGGDLTAEFHPLAILTFFGGKGVTAPFIVGDASGFHTEADLIDLGIFAQTDGTTVNILGAWFKIHAVAEVVAGVIRSTVDFQRS